MSFFDFWAFKKKNPKLLTDELPKAEVRDISVIEYQEPVIEQRNDSYILWEDIDKVSRAWQISHGAVGTAFDEFRGKYLPLPDWFVPELDPFSLEYKAQQDRLWGDMVGEVDAYDPLIHEITADSHIDPVVRPGFYSAASVDAGNHLIALGHIVRQSRVGPGARVLEYGAGFGQIALTFARLGCEVHTVDVDDVFCSAMRKQRDFFGVDISVHQEEFGFDPGGKFDLIVFYECFHHARNFIEILPKLRQMLSENGRILLAGEPISFNSSELWMPYPWGIRLDAEVAAITRFRKWYEMGFRSDFLAEAFARAGFSYTFHPGNLSGYADIHEFYPANT